MPKWQSDKPSQGSPSFQKQFFPIISFIIVPLNSKSVGPWLANWWGLWESISKCFLWSNTLSSVLGFGSCQSLTVLVIWIRSLTHFGHSSFLLMRPEYFCYTFCWMKSYNWEILMVPLVSGDGEMATSLSGRRQKILRTMMHMLNLVKQSPFAFYRTRNSTCKTWCITGTTISNNSNKLYRHSAVKSLFLSFNLWFLYYHFCL